MKFTFGVLIVGALSALSCFEAQAQKPKTSGAVTTDRTIEILVAQCEKEAPGYSAIQKKILSYGTVNFTAQIKALIVKIEPHQAIVSQKKNVKELKNTSTYQDAEKALAPLQAELKAVALNEKRYSNLLAQSRALEIKSPSCSKIADAQGKLAIKKEHAKTIMNENGGVCVTGTFPIEALMQWEDAFVAARAIACERLHGFFVYQDHTYDTTTAKRIR